GDQRSYHAHTMGLVKMSARMIENHWLTDHFQNELLLQVHTRPECIGTLMEAMIAVGQDGCILGGNRAALLLFGVSSPALRRHTVGSLLGTSLAALVTQFRRGLHGPMQIVLPGGGSLFVQARFSWRNWYALGHLQQPPTVQMGAATAPVPAAVDVPPVALAAVAPRHASSQTLQALELDSIRAAIRAAAGNVSLAARQLGVSRNTIYRKLRTEPPATDRG
ncbi:MAG TPA: helix-turn-helix domain-containing protein, partial [Burkholderiaceae bacterium]